MIKDPLIVWNGSFPYDVLEPVGVTPAMSHSDMLGVSYDLLTSGPVDPEMEQAWDELRMIRSRLLVDLVLYNVDPAVEIAAARDEVEYELGRLGVESPQNVASTPELDNFVSHLLDQLIRFDR
ncbi:MAG: hypothetical protein ACRDTG_25860 [Pseudonocardiaceae bacterium]